MITLTPPLLRLESADLIRRLRELEEAYQFKHNLIQESAYASLLKNDRRMLHLRCAHALERAYPNSLDEYAALLAQHYMEAGDEAKTFEYARRAGDAALRIHAHAEALMHYDTAGLLAARLPIDVRTLAQLHQTRGRVLELMGRYPDAVEAYRALEALGKLRREPFLEMSALLSLATLYTFPNEAQNLEEAVRSNERALALARETRQEEAEARALWNMQQHAYFTGRASDAVAYARQALRITDRLGLREQRAYILNDMSRALITAENVQQALNALEEARTIWRETNNLPMLVDNLSTTAEAAQTAGDVEMIFKFAREAQELSQTIGNVWNLAYSGGILFSIYAQIGDLCTALEWYDTSVRLSKESGFFAGAQIANVQLAMLLGTMGLPELGLELLNDKSMHSDFMMLTGWRSGGIAYMQLLLGNLDAARQELEHTRRVANLDDLSTYGPMILALVESELASQENRFADTIKSTQEIIQRLQRVQIRYLLPELLWYQGRAFASSRDWDSADNTLREAERVARATQARFPLWEILVARRQVEMERGNSARAKELLQEARTTIHWLADHMPEDRARFGTSLRESFLAQPRIQAVLAE